MTAVTVTIEHLGDHPKLVERCARWNHGAWGQGTGASLGEVAGALRRIAFQSPSEEAFVALDGGEPAGMCLLIECDLPSHAQLRPWLASLFVAPQFRRRGIGRRLVGAVEAAARGRGEPAVYLYTSLPAYYRPLGWCAFDGFEKGASRYSVMAKQLVRSSACG